MFKDIKPMAKHPGGRPRKWTPKVLMQLVVKLRRYIERETFPMLGDFAGKHGFSAQRWSDWEHDESLPAEVRWHIAEAKQMCKDKFLANVIKGGLSAKTQKSVSIFLIKALMGIKDDPYVNFHQQIVNQNTNNNQNAPIADMKDKELDDLIESIHKGREGATG